MIRSKVWPVPTSGDIYTRSLYRALVEYSTAVTVDVESEIVGLGSVYEPIITAGTTAQYWRGDKSWQTLNQAAISGLTTASSPSFTGLTVSGLTASVPVVTDAGKALASVSYATFKSSLSLAQADISGLTTASSPTFAGLTVGAYTLPSADGANDTVLTTDGAGTVTWTTKTGAGTGGINTLNSQTGATQTFANDTNVTITSAADTHTLGWSGTLSAARGGTGQSSYAVGDLPYASAATTISKLAAVATGKFLASKGVTTAPAYEYVKSTDVTHSVVTKAVADSPYSVAATDYTVLCNAVGGAMTISLPAATGTGRVINIKKIDATVNAVTVDGSGAETIDGETTMIIDAQWDNMTIQDTAAGSWSIL